MEDTRLIGWIVPILSPGAVATIPKPYGAERSTEIAEDIIFKIEAEEPGSISLESTYEIYGCFECV
jgi:hypothetical protein